MANHNDYIDIVGLENAFRTLNDLREQHPDLLIQGCSVLVDGIRDNLKVDIAQLYILLQHEAIPLNKIKGVIDECTRFKNLFNIDSIRGCDINFIAAIIDLNRGVGLMLEIVQRQAKSVLNKCMTERAKKYFDRALKSNYMIEKSNGYKWLWGEPRGKARLAYFLHGVYNPKGLEAIPYKSLQTLFRVTRLDIAVEQVINSKKPQKWRKEIDDKIFYD